MSGFKQQIERLFEHWRQNVKGSDTVLNPVEYRVLLLIDDYDIHPKGECVCIPRKQLEELLQYVIDCRLAQIKDTLLDFKIKELFEESKKKEQHHE